jgi:hypothetical protein
MEIAKGQGIQQGSSPRNCGSIKILLLRLIAQ